MIRCATSLENLNTFPLSKKLEKKPADLSRGTLDHVRMCLSMLSALLYEKEEKQGNGRVFLSPREISMYLPIDNQSFEEFAVESQQHLPRKTYHFGHAGALCLLINFFEREIGQDWEQIHERIKQAEKEDHEREFLREQLHYRPEKCLGHRGCIYVVENREAKTVKIGYTLGKRNNSLASRLSSLQCGNHVELEVLLTLPGRQEDESHLHYLFEKYRCKNKRAREWFHRTGRLDMWIRYRMLDKKTKLLLPQKVYGMEVFHTQRGQRSGFSL